MELITKSFRAQCLAFPSRVDQALAKIESVEQMGEVKEMLDKAAAMQHYAERLKAGVDIGKPISVGVLKIKAKIGELAPAKSPRESGSLKGKKGATAEVAPFPQTTIAAYRKLAANKERIEEYANATDDLPTQGGFISWVAGATCAKNTGDNEWYTPQQFIDAAKKVMGGIDCDPATSAVANKVVGAKKIFTEQDDGLTKKWLGRVWMNPPYSQPLIGKFCEKLASEEFDGNVKQAVTLTNNGTETKWFQCLGNTATAFCFPAGRIKFWHPSKESVPLQGQAICYLGENVDSFIAEFHQFGLVVRK